MSDLNDSQQIHLATNGNEAEDRLKKRLVQSRGPSTQQQSLAWVNWDSVADVLGQPFDSTNIPLSKLRYMRRDPMLAFGLATKIVPLIRANWYIKSTDAQRAAFIDRALRIIYARYILGRCNCLSFGYAPGVKRFEKINPDWIYVDPADPNFTEKEVWPQKTVDAIIWKAFVWLNPQEVEPHFNYKGEFSGIDFKANATEDKSSFFQNSGFDFDNSRGGSTNRAADIPLDWALWATNDKDSEWGSIYGYPLLGHAYRYWWSYWHKFALADRAFEKWADPPVIVYHPPENGVDANGNVIDVGNVALGVAEQARSGANVAIPSQVILDIDQRTSNVREWDIKQMETEAKFDALLETFNYLDVMKLRSLMVPEMGLIESQQGQSSRNVAEVFTDQIQKAQAVLMEEIDFEINRFLIPQLLEVNFGPGGASCTKITTGFDPRDMETMRAVVGAIANKHGDVPDVDIRETLKELGLPVLSYEAAKNKLEQLVEDQERQAKFEAEMAAKFRPAFGQPAGKPAQVKTSEYAGVDEHGYYIQPRETIVLREAPKEEDEKGWKSLLSFFQRDKERQETLYEKVAEIAEREPNVNLEVIVPEQKVELSPSEPDINLEVVVPEQPQPIVEIIEQPQRFGRMRKLFNRDNEGNILSVDEIELDDDAD